MLVASVLRPFEGFAALSGAASSFRGLHRPFWCSIVLSGASSPFRGQQCGVGGGLGEGVGGVWAADAACWLGDDG